MPTDLLTDTSPLDIYQGRFPMAEKFFADAISSGVLAHAYILKGPATGGMYHLALQVAQVMNCLNPPGPATQGTPGTSALAALACGQCRACRWVADNSHPAVLTISRLTYQVNDKGEDLTPEDLEKQAKKSSVPTQISAAQIERLLAQLNLSSAETRVIIFTDVEEWPAEQVSDVVAPFEWRNIEANQDKSFHIRPLERKLFNAASANRFLKTLEEPSPRTLFFFLADTEEQLLETIVSRCQVIPCQTGKPPAATVALATEERTFLAQFLPRCTRRSDAYGLAAEFDHFFLQEHGLSAVQAINTVQVYLREQYLACHDLMTGEPQSREAFFAYRRAQELLTTAQKMVDARVNEGQSLFHLIYSFAQEEVFLKIVNIPAQNS